MEERTRKTLAIVSIIFCVVGYIVALCVNEFYIVLLECGQKILDIKQCSIYNLNNVGLGFLTVSAILSVIYSTLIFFNINSKYRRLAFFFSFFIYLITAITFVSLKLFSFKNNITEEISDVIIRFGTGAWICLFASLFSRISQLTAALKPALRY